MKGWVGIFAAVCWSVGCLTGCAAGRYAANDKYPEAGDGYACAGTLEEVFYKSSAGGPATRRMLVYLPEEYQESDKRYPVLYLLHGARGNETSWINKGRLLQNIDSLMAEGSLADFIVAMPNMNEYEDEQDFGKSRIKNAFESVMEVDGDVEYFFMKDVVGCVDSLFRTIPAKSHRALAGLSIGAFQVIYISANNPDSFGYIGIFSPVVGTLIKHGPHCGLFRGLKHKLDRLFSSGRPELYCVMIGKGDILYPRVFSFTDMLKRGGYRYYFIISDGGHDWENWSAYCNMFMQMLWRQDVGF